MSTTTFKFLRDMWRHLAAMSLVLALMAITLLVLERAARNLEPTSVGESPASQSDDTEGDNTFDPQWLAH